MPSWWTRPLTLGCTGDDVRLVQRKLNACRTGVYDHETAARVRGLQWADKLPPTGVVDEITARVIGESVRAGLPPDWFAHTLKLWDEGDDVLRLRELLGFPTGVPGGGWGRFDRDVEQAVRRFQSAHHLPLTGRITGSDAMILGDDCPQNAHPL